MSPLFFFLGCIILIIVGWFLVVGVKKMIPRVTQAKYVDGYTIHLGFSDGTEGDVDLAQELYGEMFIPLKDIGLFKKFTIHPEFHTLCWPNGADIAPEYLYESIQIAV